MRIPNALEGQDITLSGQSGNRSKLPARDCKLTTAFFLQTPEQRWEDDNNGYRACRGQTTEPVLFSFSLHAIEIIIIPLGPKHRRLGFRCAGHVAILVPLNPIGLSSRCTSQSPIPARLHYPPVAQKLFLLRIFGKMMVLAGSSLKRFSLWHTLLPILH